MPGFEALNPLPLAHQPPQNPLKRKNKPSALLYSRLFTRPSKLSLRHVDKLVDDARTSRPKPYLAGPGNAVLKF